MRELDIGDVFSTTMRVISATMATLVGAYLVVALPGTILNLVLSVVMGFAMKEFLANPFGGMGAGGMALSFAGGFFALIVSMIVYAVAQCVMTHSTVEHLSGRPTSFGTSFRASAPRILPSIGTSLLFSLVMVIGIMLCVVPGVVALIFFVVVVPVTIVERLGPIASFERAAALSEGNRGPIFLIGLAYFVVALGFTFCISVPLGFLAGAPEFGQLPDPLAPMQLIGGAVQHLVQAVFSVFATVLLAVIYAKLRGVKDNVDAAHIASVFA